MNPLEKYRGKRVMVISKATGKRHEATLLHENDWLVGCPVFEFDSKMMINGRLTNHGAYGYDFDLLVEESEQLNKE